MKQLKNASGLSCGVAFLTWLFVSCGPEVKAVHVPLPVGAQLDLGVVPETPPNKLAAIEVSVRGAAVFGGEISFFQKYSGEIPFLTEKLGDQKSKSCAQQVLAAVESDLQALVFCERKFASMNVGRIEFVDTSGKKFVATGMRISRSDRTKGVDVYSVDFF